MSAMNASIWETTTQRVSEPGVRVVHFVSRQPSWISRMALTAFAIVLAIPILLLLIAAFVAAIVVFLLLVAVVRIRMALASLFGGSTDGQGRRNVIVRDRLD